MGMFDSIYVKCQACGETYEEQSKADDCILRDYTPQNAPPMIKAELTKYGSDCSKCGYHNTFEFFKEVDGSDVAEKISDDICSYLYSELDLSLSDWSRKAIENIVKDGIL